MDEKQIKKTKGQVLVLVTLMLVGLLAMLALVLDGGNFYTQRRAAQLAADAGALAGARAYCLAESDPVGAAAVAAQQYVTKNNAFMDNVSVAAETGDVTVDTSITFDTFFLHILGRPQLTATASATAACTPGTEGIGVMPIAWSCRPPVPTGEGGEGEEDENPLDCALDIWEDQDNECSLENGANMYLIVDSEDIEEDIICQEEIEGYDPKNPPDSDVTYVKCDIDDDGDYDLTPISGGNRSWLDLNGGGGGASDLNDWIQNGLDDPIKIHEWYAGQTGVAVSVYNTTNDYAMPKPKVIIPVFDAICPNGLNKEQTTVHESCSDLWHEEDEVIPSGGASTDYFHIISFALFDITCVDAGSNPKGMKACPVHEAAELGTNVKTIEGCFVSGFDPGLGGGQGPVDAGAVVVYLKK